MKIAVIGAGIAGVASAHELSADGHQVCVFERRGGVAAEASFGTNGILSPALRPPWPMRAVPRPPWLRLASAQGAWWWRARRAQNTRHDEAFWTLARQSIERLAHWRSQWPSDYERTEGVLHVWRDASAFDAALGAAERLRQAGLRATALDAESCRRHEPALPAATPLAGGLLLPQAEVGNCRLAAHLWRDAAERLGAEFRFATTVRAIDVAHGGVRLQFEQLALTTGFAARDGDGAERGAPQALLRQRAHAAARYLAPVGDEPFDAVVLCAGTEAAALLAPLGLRLPMQQVTGRSLTLPLRSPERGPRSAVVDVQRDITLARLGTRVRVSGGAEFGPARRQPSARHLETLYRALDDWAPGCAHLAHPQAWHGARACLPEGLPMIGGAPGQPRVWLNIGHGDGGWTLAAGAAQRLADVMAGRVSAADDDPFAPRAARF